MANEITVTVTTGLANPSNATSGGLRDNFSSGAMKANQATAGMFTTVVATSTTEANFPSTSLGTAGYMYLQNLDSTNDIDWGPASGGSMVAAGTLKAGGPPHIVYCKSTAAFRYKAAAGTPRMLIRIYEA